MLIKSIVADATGTAKLRITEEFSKLYVTSETGFQGTIVLSAFLERSGKNVEIVNRLNMRRIKTISAHIDGLPIRHDVEDTKFLLSLFENGNFKSNENDAVVVEFSGLEEGKTYNVYGLQDMTDCTSVYHYEEKNILVGERTKTFSLAGVERVDLGYLGQIEEVAFLYRDANNGLIERKFTRAELEFSVLEQCDMHPYLSVMASPLKPYTNVLVVDGLESIKVTMNDTLTVPYSLIFQSKYKVESTASQSLGTPILQNIGTAQIPNLGNVKPASGVFGSPFLGTIKRSF